MTAASLVRRRVGRVTVVAVASAALFMGMLPGAHADDPTMPSRDEVEAAERHVETTAQAVGRIKAELVVADETVRMLELDAQKAVEAYNGAVWELSRSRKAVRGAQRVADRAAGDIDRMRDHIGTAVVSDTLDGGTLADVGVLLQDPNPRALMDRLSSYRGFTGALESELNEFDAQHVVAEVLAEQAHDALARSRAAAARLEAARKRAQRSVGAAEQAAADLQARQDELVIELARAQNISVSLARKRQEALLAAEGKKARRLAEEQEQAQAQGERAGFTSRRVEAAVAFALEQVGEPYVWAAAGPRSWDCSGLTMAAWGAGGRSLPHYSVAQYDATTPVDMSRIRRGDLLFWSDGGANSIYHVALYLGDGMIVHAPRTGRNVEVVSMYYWIPPDLAGRP